MLKDSPNMGNGTHTVRNDPRITKFGRILRITKMNELPQVINVLIGDMSLVGPRPLIVRSFKKYSEEIQTIVSRSKPGITGVGSVVFRDEELLVSLYKEKGGDGIEYYEKYIFPYKGQLESWYFENKSLFLDMKLIILTFLLILNKKADYTQKWLTGLPVKPEELTINWLKK